MINVGVKETLCTRCFHREICSLKEQFLAAQNAVDNVFVSLGDHSSIKLGDIQSIKPVELMCKHYIKKEHVVLREKDTSCYGNNKP